MRMMKKSKTKLYTSQSCKCYEDNEDYGIFMPGSMLIVDGSDLIFSGLLDSGGNPLFRESMEPIGFTPEGANFFVLDFESVPEICEESIKCNRCENYGECPYQEEKTLREKAERDAKKAAKKLERETKK
jgi:hypothetical protein